ncbi:MAG: dihydropteroate synthase [Elusimicrobia bacterium]|jgi:dihydropteroate synthase|nr:dihydropteroate synthase [Elusimicrobiota bacterium]
MKAGDIIPTGCGVMGILNVTPDSFYDGGKYNETDAAVKRAFKMWEDGADIIDIGGQSTRPGSKPVSIECERERVVPVIKKIKGLGKKILISCDTSRPEIAREALESGAVMINDVTGFENKKMRVTAAEHKASIVIMHMQGDPETMQDKPEYNDVLKEVKHFLYKRADLCIREGIKKENIVIDPGIGFGKSREDNLKILANTEYFANDYPVLIGASRKSFLKDLLGIEVKERLAGSLAVAGYCSFRRVGMVRVHDVKETVETISVTEELIKRKL